MYNYVIRFILKIIWASYDQSFAGCHQGGDNTTELPVLNVYAYLSADYRLIKAGLR